MKCVLITILAVFSLAIVAFGGDDTAKVKKTGSDAPEAEKKMEAEKYVKRQADNPEIAVETSFGTMKFELFRDVAPIHVDSTLARIREGFYDSLKIFRIIANFMAQTGDPQNRGSGSAGYNLPAEFSDLPHLRGTLSMARSQDPNSASCQFFICFVRLQALDKKYTVFGHMMEGEDVLKKLEAVEVKVNPFTSEKAMPVEDVYMKKVTILKDIKKAKPEN
ncbi:MAG: peptidylprolyl isomerase [Candidatus Zixiibacteriota bacterium]|nr:MAG: peptidylprolyl isomerase [candidate division Zixibacteria bacterium]